VLRVLRPYGFPTHPYGWFALSRIEIKKPPKVYNSLGGFISAPSGKTFSYGTPEGWGLGWDIK